MSRIRSVHPGIWTDEAFVALSPFARLLFMGIWTEADDKGCFPWSPLQMKMRVLPADNTDAAELMSELESAGCIQKYEIGGKLFGAVRNFAKFQRPKKPNDIHPATPEALVFAGHSAVKAPETSEEVPNQSPTKGEKSPQMEDGGGKEDYPPTPRKRGNDGKTLIAEDWVAPPVADLPPKAKACAEQWTKDSYETHAEAFHGYWRSERKMKADWRATWANRVVSLHSQVMRDQKFGNAAPAAKPANDGKAKSPEEWLAYCEERAAHFRTIGPRGAQFVREWDERAAATRARLGIVVPKLRATA